MSLGGMFMISASLINPFYVQGLSGTFRQNNPQDQNCIGQARARNFAFSPTKSQAKLSLIFYLILVDVEQLWSKKAMTPTEEQKCTAIFPSRLPLSSPLC